MADTSIALGYRSPKIMSSAEREQEMLTLKALRQQGEQFDRQTKINEELASLSDLNDPEKLASVYQRHGMPDKAIALMDSAQKRKLDQAKFTSDQEAARMNRAKQVYDITKTATGAIMANPTLENAVYEVRKFGKITGQDVEEDLAYLQSIGGDQEAIRKWAAGHAMDADKLKPSFEKVDIGGSIQMAAIDPLTGKPTITASYDKTATPDAVMTDKRTREEGAANRNVTIRGQDMTDARTRSEGAANRSVTLRGQDLTNQRALETSANKTTPVNQKVADANDVLAILDQAEPLLDVATSSGIGAAYDQARGYFGGSTKGADAAAQLQALEGLLVSKMPKMSGPQSDKDVLLYKQMAGRIGDPTVPQSQKKAAVETIRQINSRYINGAVAAPQAPKQSQTFNAMPSPKDYVGKTIQDDKSGIKYKSDGKNWVRIQ